MVGKPVPDPSLKMARQRDGLAMARAAKLVYCPASLGTEPLTGLRTGAKRLEGPGLFRAIRPLRKENAGVDIACHYCLRLGPFEASQVVCFQAVRFAVAQTGSYFTFQTPGLCIPACGGSGSHAIFLFFYFSQGRIG